MKEKIYLKLSVKLSRIANHFKHLYDAEAKKRVTEIEEKADAYYRSLKY